MFVPSSEINFPQRAAGRFIHQHKIAVLDLRWEHTELRLDVRARVVVCDDEFAVGRTGLLGERVIASERKDIKIAVQTADERAGKRRSGGTGTSG